MAEVKIRPSVLLSIFKRKGGEGVLTKIITKTNMENYASQLFLLTESEIALVCFKQDEDNWVLLTSEGVWQTQAGATVFIPFRALMHVTLDLHNDFKDGGIGKMKYNATRLVLRDRDARKYTIEFEAGEPFWGVYQVLHHVASVNKIGKTD